MLIKLENIVSCSSEHPDFPASNMLRNPAPGPWKCAKPGELMTYVIFELPEPSCITGIDIGNYRCCIVIVTGSTCDEPDNWIPIVNHQFMTHDEAANNKWKDQVQLFTKKEINPSALKIKFDRVKVTCMQSANRRELFGLLFILLKTEVVVDMNVDVFCKFKIKNDDENKTKDSFKEKYLRLFPNKRTSYRDDLKDKVKENGLTNFNKRQEEVREPKKRPLLEKLEAGKSDEVFGKKNEDKNENETKKQAAVKRTPFGDIIPDDDDKKTPNKKDFNQRPSTSLKNRTSVDNNNISNDANQKNIKKNAKKRLSTDTDEDNDDDDDDKTNKIDKKPSKKHQKLAMNQSDNGESSDCKKKCSVCSDSSSNETCKNCKKLPKPTLNNRPPTKKAKVQKKPTKPFSALLDDVSFSLSGYVNPQRDEIRRKALKMGAKYIANPNTTDQKCSHLICAFKNTPKSQQLKGHAKILSHIFIEECFDHKKRYPWRRYALSKNEKKDPESEEEIEASTTPSPFDQDTDPESNSDADY